jgi:hypothetical protein
MYIYMHYIHGTMISPLVTIVYKNASPYHKNLRVSTLRGGESYWCCKRYPWIPTTHTTFTDQKCTWNNRTFILYCKSCKCCAHLPRAQQWGLILHHSVHCTIVPHYTNVGTLFVPKDRLPRHQPDVWEIENVSRDFLLGSPEGTPATSISVEPTTIYRGAASNAWSWNRLLFFRW